MAEHRSALGAACPVLASAIVGARERSTVHLRTGKHVMPVGRIAHAVDAVTLLGQRCLFVEIVCAVKLGNIVSNDYAFGVLPRSLADAVARIHCARPLRAQIGAPGFSTCAHCLRQRLAMPVGGFESAEIRTFSGSDAGDEETHTALLRLRRRARAQGQKRDGCNSGQIVCLDHTGPPDLLKLANQSHRSRQITNNSEAQKSSSAEPFGENCKRLGLTMPPGLLASADKVI